jgi:hypothetical protein
VLLLKYDQKPTPPKNPNKRLCVARNITFAVQKENDYWLRLLLRSTIPTVKNLMR